MIRDAYQFREKKDGSLEQVYPHRGLARIRLDRDQVRTILKDRYPGMSESKLNRAASQPWQFRSEINRALTALLDVAVERSTTKGES
jgi:predicted Mrr-cat superfamily restriction endonuclease